VSDATANVESRAVRHAALGDPVRLAIVDELVLSDRAPVELRLVTGLASNLLAHHLDVLEDAGLISRKRSSGDGRRRYVHFELEALGPLVTGRGVTMTPALFVCTHNSARSQLAAALWRQLTGLDATSAGTSPGERVHPGAVASARRAGIDLGGAQPRGLDEVDSLPAIVVTVCDRAHEALDARPEWLHWSIAYPVPEATPAAFDAARDELRARIERLARQAA